MAKLVTLKNTEGDALIAKGVISINNTAEEVEALGEVDYIIENYLVSFTISIGVNGKETTTPFVDFQETWGLNHSQILFDACHAKMQAILCLYISFNSTHFIVDTGVLFNLDGTQLDNFSFADEDCSAEYPLNYSIKKVHLLPRMSLNV